MGRSERRYWSPTETLSREATGLLQLRRLRGLVKHLEESNEFYRSRFSSLGLREENRGNA